MMELSTARINGARFKMLEVWEKAAKDIKNFIAHWFSFYLPFQWLSDIDMRSQFGGGGVLGGGILFFVAYYCLCWYSIFIKMKKIQ